MEANSQTSQPKGKRSTSRTSKLIPEAALEILTQSFRIVEESGVTLHVEETEDGVTVTVFDTKFRDGLIAPRSVTPKE